MLYRKKLEERLSPELFLNPPAEYRGAPFWAWNCRLDQRELNRQLEILKRMGFGGVHMHVRTGMSIPYLSDDFMSFIKATVLEAKRKGMLAWLYDEDRWPSGAAGGLVTREKKYRARYLLFTPFPYGSIAFDPLRESGADARASRSENGRLLACYDVELSKQGVLVGWERIPADQAARHDKWYAYLEMAAERPWFNNQTYVNTLDPHAIDRFIQITYECYSRCLAEDFGEAVPAIFTDEPQFTHKSVLKYALEKADLTIPWTDDLEDTYAKAYAGEDILANLPELFWDDSDGRVSVVRSHYHDHVCERFVRAFADRCGGWCDSYGLMLTGHMMEEPSLGSQTAALGEAMRSYRSFSLPGIDMLCASFEYTTAKQAQSVAHQYGREGVLSELYGVTNWDFDFRGHKLHGDWQAALGITVRVPHLALVSFAGEGKRDYPASINYQSPWWNKYAWIEDHFARLNTAMTRGKPVVHVGVIHPIESYWRHWGPAEQTAMTRDDMDANFQNITEWLLFGGIDFDFISESLLPELCEKPGAPLAVGQMHYDVILVPNCETLRSATLDRLEGFLDAGGSLLFAGKPPFLENAEESERARSLVKKAHCVAFERGELLVALESFRDVECRDQTGKITENLLYQFREDNNNRWLFIAHGKEPYNKDVSSYQDLRIRIRGRYRATLYDTMEGKIGGIAQRSSDDWTEIHRRIYDYDSILLHLDPCIDQVAASAGNVEFGLLHPDRRDTVIDVPHIVPYTLDEPNAFLLDQAEYALDDEPWRQSEEILRLDDICRAKLGWPSRKIPAAQPWATPAETPVHKVRLRWRILSALESAEVCLAIEDATNLSILWNGRQIPNTVTGWYVDRAIETVSLGALLIGENILEVAIPFGRSSNLEWGYLLGDFGVEAFGRFTRIVAQCAELAFGDITRQGLPFYGGNITYHIPIKSGGGMLKLRSNRYRGALQTARLDDGRELPVIFPPYSAVLGKAAEGYHTVHLTLYGHRRNSFGPVHLTDLKEKWIGPEAWRSEGEKWCYEYMLCEEGILSTPEITEETDLTSK